MFLKKILFIYFDFIYLFLETGREGKRGGEKHHCVVASHTPPTGDLACNPGMCPDGNQTGDPSILRLALNPLSHSSQGQGLVVDYQTDEKARTCAL